MQFLEEFVIRLVLPTPRFWKRISKFGLRLMMVTGFLWAVPDTPEALGLPFVIPFQWLPWAAFLIKSGFIAGVVVFALPWVACDNPPRVMKGRAVPPAKR